MIIKKIKVNNIRSYLNQEIDLPEGSVLLAGDIGSGKSSLLLAVEFALFGLQKGELSGASLLRNGKDEGSVELNLKINNKDYLIHRSLKRTKTGINQDECYLYTDGIKKQLMPIELRQLVLNLLNYPKENITKKPVIYRYTVYTPQEQMKQILFDDDEIRINTIRKIFNLDKYGKIKSNSKIIIEKLKENITKMSGIVLDLDSLIKKQEEKEAQKENINKEIKVIEEPLKKLKTEILEVKNNISKKEDEIKLLNNLKRENDILKTELKNIFSKKEYNIKKLSELESKIKTIPESNPKEKEEKENSLRLIENELKKITKNINELNVSIKKSEETIKKISNLNTCPLCEQNVAHNHKENVISRENKLITQIKTDLDNYLKKEKNYEDSLTKLKNEIESLRKKENEYNILKTQVKLNQELKNTILEEQKLLESNFNDFDNKTLKLNESLNKYKNIEEDYNQLKENLNTLLIKERQIEIKKASLDSEFNALTKEIEYLKQDIIKKHDIKIKINNYNKLKTWLTDNFIIMVETIEKNVMVKLNYDFNNIFQKWFNTMIGDENIQIKIDENFSPLIMQAGHDINYEYLSGGEKTAVALSYRLALNQTINSILSSLNTKDLIILDEPTDGFSTEQLDRVRLVLNELSAKQIILVSHESKIESFVDNVIRFNKKEHVSSINS